MEKHFDFIFQADARRIFDHFARLFNIRIVFFTADGTPVASGLNRPNCTFCDLLRKKLLYENTCHTLDRQMQLKAADKKSLVFYTCHAGMCEAVLPIYTVDKLIGYIMIGQFRTSDKFSHLIQRRWQILFRNDKLYKAFLKSPKFTKKNVDDVLGLFSVLVNFIVARHLITASGNSKILELTAYIDDHPELDLSLDQACEMLDMGISSFCSQFKGVTGKSFKSYVISRKLEKADELLTSHKNLKVHEIATLVGYSDPYLFSRIYKKHRRRPPSSNPHYLSSFR